jgi:hypothetical protein
MYIVSPDLTSGLVAHDTLVILIHSPGSNFFTLPSSKLPIFSLRFFRLLLFLSLVTSEHLFWSLHTPLSNTLPVCMSARQCVHSGHTRQKGGRGGGGRKGGLDWTGRHYIKHRSYSIVDFCSFSPFFLTQHTLHYMFHDIKIKNSIFHVCFKSTQP